MLRRFMGRWQVSAGAIFLIAAGSAFAQPADGQPSGPPSESPLARQPESVEGHFDAAHLMMRLARPELARYHLEQLLQLNPSDADLLALRDKYGTGTFLELAGSEALNPPAEQLLEKLTQAVRNQVNQPGYVEGILPKLTGSVRERAEALAELKHLGPYAVPAILQNLQSPQGVDADTLAITLSRLGHDIAPPLVGALWSPDPTIRGLAADVLGIVGSSADAIWLWYPAFGDDQPPGVKLAARRSLARLLYRDETKVSQVTSSGAADRLLKTALDHLAGRYQWPESDLNEETLSVWTWDDSSRTVAEHVVSKRSASIFFAERLARESAALAPSGQQAPVVVLAALLSRDIEQAGWDKPIPKGPGSAFDLMVRSGPAMTEQLLQLSQKEDLVGPTVASLQALARNGSADLLKRAAGASPVIAALDSPHVRVQFNAAVAILQWDPVSDFRGSRRVVEILARALNSQTRPAGVVMDPNSVRASETAGLMSELGFNPHIATTGKEGFQLAASHGDVELAVLHPNVIRWELTQTLANLRSDARTAGIPVVIYGPAAARTSYDRVTKSDPRVLFVDEATNAFDLNRELRPALAQISPPPLTNDQRARMVTTASFWLRQLAIRNCGKVFDLSIAEESLLAAVNNPAVTENALVALGAIGSPRVQQEYVEVATSPSLPPATRETAAQQLAYHISKFGSLLSETDARRIRDLWNNEPDGTIRSALASVIGNLKPSLPAARNEILSFPTSPAPIGEATP